MLERRRKLPRPASRVTSLLPSQPVSGAPRAKVDRRSSVAHSQCFWSPNQSSRSLGARMLWAGFVFSEFNQAGVHFCAFALESLADLPYLMLNYFPRRRNLAGNNHSFAPLLMVPSSGLGEIHTSIVGVWSGIYQVLHFSV